MGIVARSLVGLIGLSRPALLYHYYIRLPESCRKNYSRTLFPIYSDKRYLHLIYSQPAWFAFTYRRTLNRLFDRFRSTSIDFSAWPIAFYTPLVKQLSGKGECVCVFFIFALRDCFWKMSFGFVEKVISRITRGFPFLSFSVWFRPRNGR